MAGRGAQNAGRRRKDGLEVAAGSGPPQTFAFARVAILTTLLLMAVYTAFAVARIQSEPTRPSQGGAALPGRAATLSAQLEAELAALRGGLAAAQAALEADPDNPLEAAETGLRVAGGVARTLVVVEGDQAIAEAGQQVVRTDIPQSMLGVLSDLAVKARELPITDVELTPPTIDNVEPDYALTRSLVAEAVAPPAE